MASKGDLDDEGDGVITRGLKSTVGRESTTFGFSILVTVGFGMLQATEGTPDVARIFLYAIGAVLSFTTLEGNLSKGFRRSLPQHHTHVQSVGTSLNLLSVLAGLAAVWIIGAVASHASVWAMAPFAAGVVYLFMESLETALAERLSAAGGDTQAADVDP